MTIIDALREAVNAGCKAYVVKGHDSFGFIVTPNGNVMAVNKSTWGNGVTFTLKYNPSRKCGSGCSCHKLTAEWDFGITEINSKVITKLEKNGLEFAKQLRGELYKSAEEWKEKEYWAKNFEEVM